MKTLFLIFLSIFMWNNVACAAETDTYVASGWCGGNVKWLLDGDGALVLSGSGEMSNYKSPSQIPWFNHCSDIKSVTISNGITRIGDRAFYGCVNLNDIQIGNDMLSVGRWAFENTAYYESVSNWENGFLYIDDCLIGVSDTSISGVLDIRKGTKCIGDNALYGCSELSGIILPEGIKGIGNGAFERCSGLAEINIPTSVLFIGTEAFSSCKNLTQVFIPSNVIHIGEGIFNNCEKLMKAKFDLGMQYIANRTFYGCDSLTEVIIPEGITRIGDYAFAGCLSLKELKIPKTLNNFGIGCFEGCTNLISAIIPEGDVYISNNTYSGCTGLKTVVIPDGIKSIGRNAFSGCTGLKRVVFPKTLKNIYLNAFVGCTSVTEVEYNGSAEEWTRIEIDDGNECITGAKLICKGNDEIGFEYETDNGVFMIAPKNAPQGCIIIFSCTNGGELSFIDYAVYKGEKIVSFSPDENYDEFKILIWDSFEKMKPLCNTL